MNRNSQAHFANLPGIKIGRSKFDRSFTNKTTFNAADLVPVYVDMDIVPGDTVTMRQSEIIRMMTPITPVMDNAYLDFYWFFVPNRLIWNDFKKFMGENETAPWTQLQDIQIPQITINNGAKNTIDGTDYLTRIPEIGSVLEKMGIPPIGDNWTYNSTPDKQIQISGLPTRAYCLIWNEFFRDENLQNPVNISKSSSNQTLLNTKYSSYISDPDAAIVSYEQCGGFPPLKVCKPFDYFTGCLPGAQKGPAVTLPMNGEAPIAVGQMWDNDTQKWKDTDLTGTDITAGADISSLTHTDTWYYGEIDKTTGKPLALNSDDWINLYPDSKLVADLSRATGATITQLRQAFAIQKFYERDARGGTRYIESVKSHFGVQNPDYRLQRPEYLGGFRHNINMNQVIQSTPTVEDSTPLGTTGAYSVTSNKNNDVFTKSFTEHGILMGLCCIRTDHTYQQGINRSWFKKKRLDFYSPEFANLSEQAVLVKEIYAQGTSEDDAAFGYQEAWAEMRYMPDMITGEMRSQYAQSLDIWHYGDYYESKPELGDKWIQETKSNIERTLAVQDHDQFMADFYFGAIYTRPMPLYSIPGLIDHH